MAEVFRTKPEDAVIHESGWAKLPSGVEVLCLPLLDEKSGLFARLSYVDARAVADVLGATLMTMSVGKEVWDTGFQLQPVTLVLTETDTVHMRGRQFCQRHDERVRTQLERWDRRAPVANAGKDWISGASAGKARNGGWFRENGSPIQPGGPGSEHHDQHYTDYSQLTRLIRGGPMQALAEVKRRRQTIRRGSSNRADVMAWQAIVGVEVDGYFGPDTEEATKLWQAERGLVADGIVGERSWVAAGELFAASGWTIGRPTVAPACRRALADANQRWPGRRKASDGILGDASHQARRSDHNLGNAVDITHDPASGCDGDELAAIAIEDPRVTYVIWKKRIFNRSLGDTDWRPYTGSNPHTHHVHISVHEDTRDDDGPWGWLG